VRPMPMGGLPASRAFDVARRASQQPQPPRPPQQGGNGGSKS